MRDLIRNGVAGAIDSSKPCQIEFPLGTMTAPPGETHARFTAESPQFSLVYRGPLGKLQGDTTRTELVKMREPSATEPPLPPTTFRQPTSFQEANEEEHAMQMNRAA